MIVYLLIITLLVSIFSFVNLYYEWEPVSIYNNEAIIIFDSGTPYFINSVCLSKYPFLKRYHGKCKKLSLDVKNCCATKLPCEIFYTASYKHNA